MTGDRLSMLVLALAGVVGFVVLAIFDQFAAASVLLTAIPSLGVLIVGRQVADVKEHVADLSNGALVDTVRQGVTLGLAEHLESGIVEEPYRPPHLKRKEP